jgi:eukaryotic-like serine/threonine-protein kinase
MIGRTIKGWKIIEELGSGGMCNVYKAENEDMEGSYAAIKCLREENFQKEDLRDRFQDEAEKMLNFQKKSGISHKNIIEFKNFKKEEDNYFLITEYVEGITLKKHIKEDQGAIPPEKANNMFSQILEACNHMHKHNFVHRDLKPDNIMLKPSGRIKILDFGIAKLFEDKDDTLDVTKAGVLVGTPKYMSPEQIQGKKINHLTDIYSLGVILHEMLTGKYCFPNHQNIASLSLDITQTILPSVKKEMEYLPPSYDNLIAKATVKDPSKRIQSCEEMIQLLNKIIGDKIIPITIKLSDLLMADITIDGVNSISNEMTFNGNIGNSYPLAIEKKGYRKIDSSIKVRQEHESNGTIQLNLKKKFLGIF